MHFMEAITILIARIFATTVANGFVPVSPFFKARIDVVLIGVHQRAYSNACLDQRLNRFLLDVRKHSDDDLAASLNHAKHRWLFFFQRTAPTCAL